MKKLIAIALLSMSFTTAAFAGHAKMDGDYLGEAIQLTDSGC